MWMGFYCMDTNVFPWYSIWIFLNDRILTAMVIDFSGQMTDSPRLVAKAKISQFFFSVLSLCNCQDLLSAARLCIMYLYDCKFMALWLKCSVFFSCRFFYLITCAPCQWNYALTSTVLDNNFNFELYELRVDVWSIWNWALLWLE